MNEEVIDKDQIIYRLFKDIDSLKKKIHDLETEKVITETQLPMEILEGNSLLPTEPVKFKRGHGYRPLLKSEIEEAKKHSQFAAGQARWLKVSFPTFKKYAKLYGLYEPNQWANGRRNLYNPENGKYPLSKILAGEFENNPLVNDWMVKDKLIRSGTLPPECDICGYNKRRIVDKKICLLLNHKDGNLRNYKLENLQLLCLNCTFECGRGYIRSGKFMFDVDWFQGARKEEIDDISRW